MRGYTTDWFRSFRESAGQSAATVVPLILELTEAQSIVDVGCGVGAWLAEYRQHGVEDYLGVDGDYVDPGELVIDPDHFVSHDLRESLRLDRRFDFCQCLEVAEHLPARCADALVDSLVALAPIVFFSAAIPGQGGTHHVNEQWPAYWIERFETRGYRLVDAIRHRIWNDPNVDFWYAQNAVLFVEESVFAQNARLRDEHARTRPEHVAMVHPYLFERTARSLSSTWDQRWKRILRHAVSRVRRRSA